MRVRLALLGLLAGCAPQAEPGDPAVQLGTGEIDFSALVDGQDLPIIRGPQGGYHLLGAIRTHDLEPGLDDQLGHPDNPTVTFDVTRGGESLLHPGMTPLVQGLEPMSAPEDPWTHQLLNRFVILDIADDDELDGAAVELGATVDDVDGVHVEQTVDVHLYPHPLNE